MFRLFRDRDSEGVGLKGTFGDISGMLDNVGVRGGDRKGYEDIEEQPGSASQNESQSQTQQTPQASSEQQRGGGKPNNIAPEPPSYYFSNDC